MTRTPANVPHFIFRYFSNRGTDQRICVALPRGTTTRKALEVAKEWAEKATAGTACFEYTVQVHRVKRLSVADWRKKWDAACKARDKANDKWQNLRALSIAYDWTKETP